MLPRVSRLENCATSFVLEQCRGARCCDNLVYPLLRQRCIDRYVRSARFHRAEKCDQHLWFAMSEHSDRATIISKAPLEIRRKRVGTPSQFAIGQPSKTADMRDRIWRHCGPVINSFD